MVVGEPEVVKVHVHTDDPTRVINLAGGYGKLMKLNVGDMSTQHRRILETEGGVTAGGPPRPNGVGLAVVVAGRGLVHIFRGLGVDAIIEGGQTMNPSTQDMLTAIESVPYDEVILLPNNGNVIPAAKQVMGLTNDRLEFAGSDYAEVVNKALGKLGPDSYELVTVYRGEQASDDEMKRLESEIRSSYPGLEVEVQQGGQQHYPFILSVE